MYLPRITFPALLLALQLSSGSACLGCVDLDEITFDKITAKFEYSLIKFDIAFPYGEKHESFAFFSKEINPQVERLLVGTVGIKDYGEKDNEIFMKRFKIPEKSFPSIYLFKRSDPKNWNTFPQDLDVTVDNLKNFVRQNTDLYIGLKGCLKAFDDLATDFIKNFNRNEFGEIEKVLQRGQMLLDGLKEEDSKTGIIYLQIIRRIKERGLRFINEERDRVKKLLGTKITDAKKRELIQRLNILVSFKEDVKSGTKSEL